MKRIVLMLVAIVMMTSSATAQPTVSQGTYRLKPEDVITVQIYLTDINATLPVGIDGNVSFPFVGTVKAAGKTTRELEYELAILYSENIDIVDPIVSITIVSFRPTRASVTGTVQGGTFTMREGDRIINLITAGGGVRSTSGFANLRRAYLIRRDNDERIPIDIYALIVRNDSTQDYLIEDGDILVIPDQEELTVTVNGRVRNPGTVAYREGLKLSQVLANAGEVERRSKMSQVQVFRRLPGVENRVLAIHCNMVLVHDGKDPRQDIQLQAGDFIYVPDSGNLDFTVIGSDTNFLFYLDRFGIDPFGIGR